MKYLNLLVWVYCTLYYSKVRTLINFNNVYYMEKLPDDANTGSFKTRIHFDLNKENGFILDVEEDIEFIGMHL
jgi:hypothetical protein